MRYFRSNEYPVGTNLPTSIEYIRPLIYSFTEFYKRSVICRQLGEITIKWVHYSATDRGRWISTNSQKLFAAVHYQWLFLILHGNIGHPQLTIISHFKLKFLTLIYRGNHNIFELIIHSYKTIKWRIGTRITATLQIQNKFNLTVYC